MKYSQPFKNNKSIKSKPTTSNVKKLKDNSLAFPFEDHDKQKNQEWYRANITKKSALGNSGMKHSDSKVMREFQRSRSQTFLSSIKDSLLQRPKVAVIEGVDRKLKKHICMKSFIIRKSKSPYTSESTRNENQRYSNLNKSANIA